MHKTGPAVSRRGGVKTLNFLFKATNRREASPMTIAGGIILIRAVFCNLNYLPCREQKSGANQRSESFDS